MFDTETLGFEQVTSTCFRTFFEIAGRELPDRWRWVARAKAPPRARGRRDPVVDVISHGKQIVDENTADKRSKPSKECRKKKPNLENISSMACSRL